MSILLQQDEAALSVEEFENLFWLFAVAGNETLRNGLPGGMIALLAHDDAQRALRADPALLPDAVEEMLRWWTPVMVFRRTATRDFDLGGHAIRKGDKVVMWYVSGNRDETVIADPERFVIDRDRPRQHVAFGFGIHRCLGNRLAEMQLKVVWEEILKRFERLEVVGPPQRLKSSFIKGYEHIPVRIPA